MITLSFRRVIRKDHVCATYKNNYRGKANFISSNCLVMDVDNDHSENPEERITPEHLAVEYKGIAAGLNNLQKLSDGTPLGGHSRAEDDFADLDDEDDFLD